MVALIVTLLVGAGVGASANKAAGSLNVGEIGVGIGVALVATIVGFLAAVIFGTPLFLAAIKLAGLAGLAAAVVFGALRIIKRKF